MSEYQRYEFMTSDRPLTRAQLEAANTLSSHIEASSTHALIEYHWSGFKHDPIPFPASLFTGPRLPGQVMTFWGLVRWIGDFLIGSAGPAHPWRAGPSPPCSPDPNGPRSA